MRSIVCRGILAGSLLLASRPAVAQQIAPLRPASASPVADAFRTYVRELYPKLILAAEYMPADKYGTQTATTTLPFRELLFRVLLTSRWICYRISTEKAPFIAGPEFSLQSPKDSVIERLRDDAQFCETRLASLSDTSLGERIGLDLRPDGVGALPHIPRSVAILNATAFWADMHARVAETLRANGIVPPKPSNYGVSDPNPGSGLMRCVPTRWQRDDEQWGGNGYVFTLSDASASTPYTVTSDGSGPYTHGTSNIQVVSAGRAGVMVLGGDPPAGTRRRAIRVNLNQPVPGGGGIARGIVVDSTHLEVAAQWKAEPYGDRRRAHVLADIPVGTTVEAAQLDVQFHIDGFVHALQVGPQPIGHCFSDAPAISGDGTSRATIAHPDEKTWIVDLPPGSIGRLYDVHLSYPHAVDRGLYRVALRFVIQRR
jgi:hypothetical protein